MKGLAAALLSVLAVLLFLLFVAGSYYSIYLPGTNDRLNQANALTLILSAVCGYSAIVIRVTK